MGALPNFEAYSVDADGVYTTITSKATWTSSNAAVMLSSAGSGFFFIAGPGSADVNATYQGVVGSLTVTARSVPPYPYLKISLPGLLPGVLSARLVLGPTQNVLSQDISALVVWSSSNTNVATVQDGRVSPVAPGNAEIRASYNGLTDSCFFSVPPRGSESIVR